MKKQFCFIIFILICFKSLAQDYTIKVKFNKPPKKVFITGLYVDQFKMIDSVDVVNHIAEFKVSQKSMPINYQLLNAKPTSTKAYKIDKSFFFYFENENIEIESPDSLVNNVTAKIIKGKRLKDYIHVEDIVKKYEYNIRKNMSNIFSDPKKYDTKTLATINQELHNQYNTVKEEYEKILNKNSQHFQSVMHLLKPFKITLTNNDELNRLALLNAFNNTYHFDKQVMMFTPLLKDRLNSYLSLYRSRVLTYEQNQNELKNAVDQFLKNTSNNKNVQYVVMKSLLLYIRKYSYDEALLYFDKKYISKIKDDMDVKFMDYLIAPYRKCAPGQKAENFITKDINNKELNLYDIKSKYTGLLFFSSSCSHCRKEFPLINKWYNSIDKSKLKIITIALDTEKESWEKFLNNGKYPFLHVCDFKSWNSPIVKKYNIHGTPSLIVLDDKKIIMKKIVEIDDIKSFFADKL